jgi:5,10-methylenetetrahydromethanopterin reductase
MRFGVHGPADISKVKAFANAENLGYETAWVGDSPMLWSDAYITLSHIAAASKKLSVGTGISVVDMRLAPVVAAAAATINKQSPGRIELGIGTGFSAVALFGQKKPAKPAEFRDFVRVVRGLLDGGEVDFEFKGNTAPIKFQIPDGGFINVEYRVPLYLAAMGPKGQELCGEYADGIYTAWGPVSEIDTMRARVRAGADKAGRSLDKFRIFGPAAIVVLDPGEDVTSDRVMEEAGLSVILAQHV